jgi:hypothetical protein
MIPISRRGIVCILSSCFFFLILLFISDGCKSDSGSTGPASVTNTYPTVAPNWRGSATLTPGTAYSLTAAIGQNLEKVGGVCFWTTAGGAQAAEQYDGTITTSGQITLRGIKFYNNPGSEWRLDTLNASISADGGTISGGFTSRLSGGASGTFVLAKQSATFPSVSATWAGIAVIPLVQGGTVNLTGNFVQAMDLLGGSLSFNFSETGFAKEYFTGSITTNRQIALKSASFELSASYTASGNTWYTGSIYNGTMSSRGDTIDCSWTNPNGTIPGSIWLVKQ